MEFATSSEEVICYRRSMVRFQLRKRSAIFERPKAWRRAFMPRNVEAIRKAIDKINHPIMCLPHEFALFKIEYLAAQFHASQRISTTWRTMKIHIFPVSLITSVLTVALLAGSAAAQPAQPAESSITLKDAFRDKFKIGAAINRTIATGALVRADNVDRTLEQVQADAAHIIKQFNQISPENDLKWQLIHPTAGPDGYNWDPADAYVNFGVTNKMYIVGHTLVWHGQTPNWVFQETVRRRLRIPMPAGPDAAAALASAAPRVSRRVAGADAGSHSHGCRPL